MEELFLGEFWGFVLNCEGNLNGGILIWGFLRIYSWIYVGLLRRGTIYVSIWVFGGILGLRCVVLGVNYYQGNVWGG
jgi:hypothetical protein